MGFERICKTSYYGLSLTRVTPTLASLREQVSATGFDFAASPFQQVWLFAKFTGGAVLLYAASPAAT